MKPDTQATMETLLDEQDEASFAGLLDTVAAPGEACEAVALVDLKRGRRHVVGDPETIDHAWAWQALGLQDASVPPPPPGQLLALQLGGYMLLPVRGRDWHVVAVQYVERMSLARLRTMHQELASVLEKEDQLKAASSGAVHWHARYDAQTLACISLDELRTTRDAFPAASVGEQVIRLILGQVQTLPGLQALLHDDGGRLAQWRRVPFVPRLAVGVSVAATPLNSALYRTAVSLSEDVLRNLIGLCLSNGLETQIKPFPQSEVEFDRIVSALRALSPDDLLQRLILGGFADHPVEGEMETMRCRECIYFLPHRRWCDLPELPLPVEADWYCRLWKL